MIKKVEIASVNTAKLPVLSNKEKNELLISNIVPPELVEKFIKIRKLFNFELKIIIFNHTKYYQEFIETHTKNGPVDFKLNNQH